MDKVLRSYRIFKSIYLNTANTGDGASLFPGRWNHRNIFMLYSSGTLSLSCLEIVVNANVPLLDDYLFIEYQFKESFLEVVDKKHLPSNWMADPASDNTKDIGDKWIKSNKSAVLRVPSSVIPQENNYLINPNHVDFTNIIQSKASHFIFDDRLLKAKASD